jgi:predicted helicase
LCKRVETTIDFYNDHVHKWQRLGNKKPNIDDFVDNDATRISWSSSLKKHLERGVEIVFATSKVRSALYRPYTFQYVYFDQYLNHRPSVFLDAFPKANSKNSLIWIKVGGDWPFFALVTDKICDQMPQGGTQSFPLFTYSEDGKERRDNITPKARTLFQIFYDDDTITQADIFHYVYAVLHHPIYRARFAENLKRELPRIPFVGVAAGEKNSSFFPLAAVEKMQGDAKPDHNPKASAKIFHAFAAAGQQLADLHVNYESAKEFKLKRVENKEVKLDWRVEAMKLTKDKSAIVYNDFLTLEGIPPEVFDYKLGNRSALDWVIDQYRVTRDAQGNLASDPNRMDDEEYIVRLIGQVVTVSLETLKVIASLPPIMTTD